jgi:hypothetical protein
LPVAGESPGLVARMVCVAGPPAYTPPFTKESMRMMRAMLFLGVLLAVCGCAQRTLTITSEPFGAVVFLNGEEVGRTPVRVDFDHYGDYDVVLRQDGFEALKTNRKLAAPIMGVPPLDLLGELFGVRDHRQWHFQMAERQELSEDPNEIVARGLAIQKELRSSPHTRAPTTIPATQPATRPDTNP